MRTCSSAWEVTHLKSGKVVVIYGTRRHAYELARKHFKSVGLMVKAYQPMAYNLIDNRTAPGS